VITRQPIQSSGNQRLTSCWWGCRWEDLHAVLHAEADLAQAPVAEDRRAQEAVSPPEGPRPCRGRPRAPRGAASRSRPCSSPTAAAPTPRCPARPEAPAPQRRRSWRCRSPPCSRCRQAAAMRRGRSRTARSGGWRRWRDRVENCQMIGAVFGSGFPTRSVTPLTRIRYCADGSSGAWR